MGPFMNASYASRKIGSWYQNDSRFALSIRPWFVRGGSHSSGLEAGVFAFGSDLGHQNNWTGFRIVLSI